jgi:hypothetical protein
LSEALLNPAGLTAIGLTATVSLQPGRPAGRLEVRLNVSPESLALKDGKGARAGKVKEMYVELDAAGKMLMRQAATSQFSIGPDNQAAFDRRGITIQRTLELIPAAARLAIIVQDTVSGQMGSVTVPLAEIGPN